MNPLLISSGEPAGVGPDLCLELAGSKIPLVILGDLEVLKARALALNKKVIFVLYNQNTIVSPCLDHLYVFSVPCSHEVVIGQSNSRHAEYVLKLLQISAAECAAKNFSALVTAPVNKAVINAAGFKFTGHTEFYAQYYNIDTVVMMLASSKMKVALVTTHIPLRDVAHHISKQLIVNVVSQLHKALVQDFGVSNPVIKVSGLNPHAGEAGYLGTEEITVIQPALLQLQDSGINAQGPYPADTLFIKEQMHDCDAYVAMYHDQGLTVIKHAYFNEAVNVTLGLPIIRTSVDHGTAEHLAGKNQVDSGSMHAAVTMAYNMASLRVK